MTSHSYPICAPCSPPIGDVADTAPCLVVVKTPALLMDLVNTKVEAWASRRCEASLCVEAFQAIYVLQLRFCKPFCSSAEQIMFLACFVKQRPVSRLRVSEWRYFSPESLFEASVWCYQPLASSGSDVDTLEQIRASVLRCF